jgi:hypothetical protein
MPFQDETFVQLDRVAGGGDCALDALPGSAIVATAFDHSSKYKIIVKAGLPSRLSSSRFNEPDSSLYYIPAWASDAIDILYGHPGMPAEFEHAGLADDVTAIADLLRNGPNDPLLQAELAAAGLRRSPWKST